MNWGDKMKIYTFNLKQLLLTACAILTLCVCITAGTVLPTVGSVRLLPIYSVDTPEKTVALTFDCAWGDADTDKILKVLDQCGVKATFFVTGDYVDRCADSVKKFHAAGHEIANHSDVHPHVNNLSVADLTADTNACSAKIKAITGTAPTLYRAPYGEYNNSVVETITDLGYSFIQWDCDSIDYKNPSAEEMRARIHKKVQNGSILLFHTGTENTASALGGILADLQAQGYTFKPVGQLIYKENFLIDHAGRQRKML